MTKKEIIDLLMLGIKYDSWCQECGTEDSSKALYQVLKAEKIPIPDWLLKHFTIEELEQPFTSDRIDLANS